MEFGLGYKKWIKFLIKNDLYQKWRYDLLTLSSKGNYYGKLHPLVINWTSSIFSIFYCSNTKDLETYIWMLENKKNFEWGYVAWLNINNDTFRNSYTSNYYRSSGLNWLIIFNQFKDLEKETLSKRLTRKLSRQNIEIRVPRHHNIEDENKPWYSKIFDKKHRIWKR